MSQSNLTQPSTSEVREGRLLKKIAKLQQQRDHHKQQHEYYARVISMQPHLERRFESYTEMKKELERVKALEKRIKEQEILIRLLAGDKIPNHEIDHLYSKLIKEEYKRMNDEKKS